ncbi:MAG TPA: hypothetical protein VIV60_02030 [Polyangiaceae bacterium]
MKKSPLAAVKDGFESKEKLVEAVTALTSSDLWIDRLGAKGLARVSNNKLLKLHRLLKDAKERFGTRDKLVSSVLEAMSRSKDAGMRAKLASLPLPRLLDVQRASARQAKKATKTA